VSGSPRAVIGLTVYNGERHLAEAIESFLSQTRHDFALLVVDDASTDGTAAIAERYAALDDRVTYLRSQTRLGMIGNWRRAYEEARARYPSADYFAWASDHDIWHRSWLFELAAVLDREPDVVLAYPLDIGVSESRQLVRGSWRFDTAGLHDRSERVRSVANGMTAGNMIYGLMRAELPERCGVFRRTLLPDRLLLFELALHGEFQQVPRTLWYRRYLAGVRPSLQRQRMSLFRGRAPAYTRLPWWIVHASFLLRALLLGRSGPRDMGAVESVRAVAAYCRVSAQRERRKRLGRIRARAALRKRLVAQRHRLARLVRKLQSTLRIRTRVKRFWRRRRGRRPPTPRPTPVMQAEPASSSPAVTQDMSSNHYSAYEPADRDAALAAVANDLALLLELVRHGRPPSDEVADATSAHLETLLTQVHASRVEERAVWRAMIDEERSENAWSSARLRRNPGFDEFGTMAQPVIASARTLLDRPRLYTIWQAIRNVAHLDLPAAEVGVYRGGSAKFIADTHRRFAGRELELHVFDTFTGHVPDSITDHDSDAHRGSVFRDVAVEDVSAYLADFPLVRIHEGDARELLPRVEVSRFGFVHLDVDLYEPTLRCLREVAPRLAAGGAIVVDDVGAPKCPGVALALQEFMAEDPHFHLWYGPEQAVLIRIPRHGRAQGSIEQLLAAP
jgi:glycosyltransferase involved in cell wall biosynthesis